MINSKLNLQKGFTIVELLIVVVVIAILAAITIVSYNGITANAKESAIKSDLATAAKKLNVHKIQEGSFPSPGDNQDYLANLTYSTTPSGFCVQGSANNKNFHITEAGSAQEGECPLIPIAMQTITNANCTEKRMLGYDARDNHTYWIQKMPDGKCWMLTNLAYGGGISDGGTGVYGDVLNVLIYSPVSGAVYHTYTEPRYYISASKSNPTTLPVVPSDSVDGGVTDPQFGYYYNYCAAMGGQADTSACLNASLPLADTTVSVCPSGWRLPTQAPVNELKQLNDAVNGGLTNNGSGLYAVWMGQGDRYWHGTFTLGGSSNYRSSTQASSTQAYILNFRSNNVQTTHAHSKAHGRSVRCVAS